MSEYLGLEKIRELKAGPVWRDWQWRRWLFAAIAFLALTTTLVVDFLPDKITGLQEGRPSPKTVKAYRDAQVVDDEATASRRADAAKAIGNVYTFNPQAESRAVGKARQVFAIIRDAQQNTPLSVDMRYKTAADRLGSFLARSDFNSMLSLAPEQLASVEARTVTILEKFFEEQITPDDLGSKKEKLIRSAYESNAPATENQIVANVGSAELTPNFSFDRTRTEKLKKEAAAEIEPVLVKKQKGEEIVGEGKIVTRTQIKLLRELGLFGRSVDVIRVIGYSLLSFAIVAAFVLYLHNYHRKIYENGRLLFVLGSIIVGTVFISKVAVSFSLLYLVPVIAAGMLTTLLFSVELATGVVIMTALYAGLIAGQDFRFAFVWLIGGLFAVYTVWQVKHRTDLARAGIMVSLVVGALAVAMTLISSSPSAEEIITNLGWGLIGGLFASVLTIGFLPFLEKMSGITTDIRLVELSYANQPLMRELMLKAPGTYSHSIMTGNLAESAAEQVGADPLLARVGAYYHDIGKIKRPLFFVENQFAGENPHDNTNPNLSCLVITSHVKEGLELAETYRLPKEICNIIAEHHGTGVVSYFYHRAKEELVKEEVFESDFRYSGPRPQSKEAAIVMLADSVEAAARTIAKPTPNRLEQLIKRVVQQKLDDGQLSESDLTLRDLDKIVRCFTQALASIYHTRVEYPVPLPARFASGNFAK